MPKPTAYPLPFVMEAWDNRLDPAQRRFAHTHGGHELLLVLNVGTTVIHRGVPINAPVNALFLHRDGEEHGIIGDGSPVRIAVINFEPDERFESGFPGLQADAGRSWHLDGLQLATYTDYFTRIQAELDNRHPGWQQSASAWLRLLLILIGRLDARIPRERSHATLSPVDEQVHRLRRAIDHMRQGSAHRSLSEMFTDYDSLRQRFRRVYGISPNQMLQRQRMDIARSSLSDTDHSIAEIARRVGYARQHEFARAFRRVCGCSPSTYRRLHRRG